MIKLIVSDMDGTLLKNDGTLPKNFDLIFNTLKEKGILFCVASGRQYDTLIQYFKKYQNEMGFISENGAYAVLHGQEIHQDSLDKNQIREILDLCQNIPDIGAILCGKKGAYLNNSDKNIQRFFSNYYPNYQLVNDLEKVDDMIFKIAIYDPKGSKNNSYSYLKNFKNLKIVLSGKQALDISKININKGNTLALLQEKLGVSEEETMVFGDYLNDLEMMKKAKFSFAMKNAQPEVIQAANFTTEYNNDEEGVIKTIKKEMKIV